MEESTSEDLAAPAALPMVDWKFTGMGGDLRLVELYIITHGVTNHACEIFRCSEAPFEGASELAPFLYHSCTNFGIHTYVEKSPQYLVESGNPQLLFTSG